MTDFSKLASDGTVLLAVIVLLYVAWHDFWYLKIRNEMVLVLLALYLIWAFLNGFGTLAADLGTGLILFVIGLVMWSAKKMGGGDVKLYFALGLFMGFAKIGLFAIALLMSTFLFLGLLRLASKGTQEYGVLGRLGEIHVSGKAPYAVLMCFASIPVILLRVIDGG